MPTPTEGEIQTQISNLVELLQTEFATAAGFLTDLDTSHQAVEGDYVAAHLAGLEALRASKASVLSRANIRRAWDPLWLAYGRNLDVPESSVEGVIRRVYRNFVDNSKSIKHRAFTFGSPSAGGGNVGNGLMRRLNDDADNQEIEIGLAEAFVAECIADQGQTGIHEEVFQLRGADASLDGLENLGTGAVATISAVSARRSLLKNPSFTAGVSGSSVSSWTFTAGAASNTAKDTTNVYRSAGHGDTATALNLTATVSLQQKIATTGIRLSRDVPYYLQIAYNRAVGSGSGTLVIRLGAANTSVAVSAQSGWNILFIPITAANCWWKGFKENDLDITVEWTRTGGDLLIDDFILTPMSRFRGQWYAIIGGSTPFLLRDQFTWSDTISSDSKIQYWLQRVYGQYLPHDASPTWADP